MKGLFKLIAVAIILVTVLALYGRAGAPTVEQDTQAPVAQMPSTGDPDIDKLIVEKGTQYGVDPMLVYAVMRQESNFKNKATSNKNAQGLMQIIPATADRFDIDNPYDPQQNIDCGVRYLRWLLKEFNGDVRLALAGYNAGEGNVKKYGNRVPDFKETKQYVAKIIANYGKTYHPVLDPQQARVQFGIVAPIAN